MQSAQLSTDIEALFIESDQGKLFSLFFPAQKDARGSWLYVPPFAEEMNRCRSSVAAQAKALSAEGYNTLVLDLYGTGESEGDFSDASMTGWMNDIHSAADWLEKRTGLATGLWGCRLGATLAMQAASEQSDRYKQLLLWQPILNGKTFVTQYLRLRVASLMARNLPAEDTNSMRATLADGTSLEVAGYVLNGKLIGAIDALNITENSSLKDQTIYWHENVLSAEKPLSMISRKTIEKLRSQGCHVDVMGFTGPTIWQAHERVEVPELIHNTLSLLGEK